MARFTASSPCICCRCHIIQEQQQRREQSKKSFVAPISPFRESIGIGTYFCAQNLNLRIFFLTHVNVVVAH